MINSGIKVSLKDYISKVKSGADFFEILYEGNYSPSSYSVMISSIKKLKKPFFFHLSTTFIESEDIFLLNYASKNTIIKNNSRRILSQEIKKLFDYLPKGYIVHSPTMFDFSKNKKIIGKMNDLQSCLDSFSWLNSLAKNIYVENSAEAINIGNRNYFTRPISNITSKKYDMSCLLDTGHFYTTCLVFKKKFSSGISASFLKNFSYFHISTLNKKTPHDTHGIVFLSSNNNYPSSRQLKKIILEIQKNEKETGNDCYVVCEPSGGSKSHLKNFDKLVGLFAKNTKLIYD